MSLMQPEPIATFTTPEPNGEKQWEYRLYPETLVFRGVGQWDASETTLLLCNFTTEEIRRSSRTPFVWRTEIDRGAGALLMFGLMMLGAWWATMDHPNKRLVEPLRWCLGVLGFVVCLSGVAIVGVRYARHDWREWRWVDFVYQRDREAAGTVTIIGEETGYAEHDRFLELFRAQIRICRTNKASE